MPNTVDKLKQQLSEKRREARDLKYKLKQLQKKQPQSVTSLHNPLVIHEPLASNKNSQSSEERPTLTAMVFDTVIEYMKKEVEHDQQQKGPVKKAA